MSPFIPIVVGITGKRDLGGKEAEVRRALDETLAEIEKRFENSPLVLASGLAKGADLLAAEVALKRPLWTIVGVLPFAPKLFLEDFASPEDAKWRERLLAFLPEENPNPGDKPLQPNPRFVKKVLKPLRKSEKSDERFTDSDLHRTEGNPIRRKHYEQVGLVIADRCTLLIAVKRGAEGPGKVGGTARIAQYKHDGKLDMEAREVARASQEIAPPEPLDCEVKGLVRVIDLDRDAAETAQEALNKLKRDNRYAWITLEAIDTFNAAVRNREMPPASVPMARQVLKDSDADAAAGYVLRLRRTLSNLQGRAKDRLTLSMWVLAGLFVASVAILEIFAKLLPDMRWLFLGYAVLVAAGLSLIYQVRREDLSAFTEDYRGGAEAMRVQVEWWRLGLRGPTHRVHRYYLVGGEGHFSVLRSGIKAAVDAAVLLSPEPSAPGQPLELEQRSSWLPNQIDFFRRRSDERHRSTIRLSSFAWYLFQASVGAGLAVGALMLLTDWELLGSIRQQLVALLAKQRLVISLSIFVVAALWAILFLVLVRAPEINPLPKGAPRLARLRHWIRYTPVLGTHGRHSTRHGWVLALPLGVLMVPALLAITLTLGLEENKALHKTEKVALVFMIVLASCSGAMRFVMERRVLEAEAVSYREALQRFMTAKARALETRERAKSATDPAKAILKEDQELGFDLGKVALAENEAWLRAHRQRPIEPIG